MRTGPSRWFALGAFCLALASRVGAQPSITFVANNASDRRGFSPGALVNIFGQNFGTGSTAGLTVTAGGRACHVLSNNGPINAQLPVDLPVGQANLVVERQGQASAPFPIRIDAVSPAIFTFGSGRDGELGRIQRANGSLISAQNAPSPGETVSLSGTGFGPANPVVPTGVAPPPNTPLLNPAIVRVGGRSVPVLFAGLSQAIGVNRIVFVLPGDITRGSYSLTVEIAGAMSNVATIPITVTGLVVSQAGFTFSVVQGGGTPPPRSFSILNGTPGALTYTVTATTFGGGPGWISVNPASAPVAANAAATLDVRVDQAGLAAGDYYAELRVEAPGAPNSPQFLSVIFNVVAANVNPGPIVEPAGLVLVGLVNSTNTPAQSTRIANVGTQPSPFNAAASSTGRNFFTVSPAAGTVNPGQPVNLAVQPALAGLPAGVYRGAVTIQFPRDNTSRVVDVLLVVVAQLPAAAGGAAPLLSTAPSAGGCAPTRLLPVLATLGASFAATLAWPAPIEVVTVDDCGEPMRSGSVVASFSNGDPPLSLLSRDNGRWSGTWTPRNRRTPDIRLTVSAVTADGGVSGVAEVSGAVANNEGVPTVNANGVVSAASFSPAAAPSPGEIVSVFGARLADGVVVAESLPLPQRLGDTVVLLGGRVLPLVFVSDGQVNAVVPFDIPPGTAHQLVVRKGSRVSVPEAVAVQPAEPAVFTIDLMGRGQGHAYVIPTPTEQVLADRANPAKAGDAMVLYCTGLGAVIPPAVAGTPTPSDALRRTTAEVAVTIGGVTAQVAFAGLTPGFTGLYQVNVTVPAGVEPGDQVPVVVTIGGISSPPVQIAVRRP